MKFARIVYLVAGLYGLLVLTPGLLAPPVSSSPLLVYGFFASAFVWQLLFLVIARWPERLRLLMPVTVLEKAAFFGPALVLHQRGAIPADATFYGGLADGMLMVLFALAWWWSGRAQTV
jgi:hypothetical protein